MRQKISFAEYQADIDMIGRIAHSIALALNNINLERLMENDYARREESGSEYTER